MKATEKVEREKFTTTLDKDTRDHLNILTAVYGFNYINEYIEDRVRKEWKRYKNEMAKKNNNTRQTK